MSRSGRLFELLIKLDVKTRFTVKELAEEFNVSRRTMLRDLQLLSEIGVPLYATPGPNGGYSILKRNSIHSLSLSAEEAVGMILSYESLQEYQDGPFQQEVISTISKLRSILPTERLEYADKLKSKIKIDTPIRSLRNPFLKEILDASLEDIFLKISYDSRSGSSERTIFPFGIFLSSGLWYCLCFCFTRNDYITLRIDRIKALEIYDKFDLIKPQLITLKDWPSRPKNDECKPIKLKAKLTPKGCKLADPDPFFGEALDVEEDQSGTIDMEIHPSDIDWCARFFIRLGKDAVVLEPLELKDYIINLAKEVLANY